MSSLQHNIDIGHEKLKKGDYLGALTHADAALALDASSFAALQLRGRALYLLGQDNAALQTLRQAHAVMEKLLPNYASSAQTPDVLLSDETQLFGVDGGFDALETLIALREHHTLDAELLDLLAKLAEDSGRLAEARRAYEDLISLQHDRLDAWEGLVDILCHEDLDAAKSAVEHAIVIFPNHAIFYEFLGFIYFRRRKFRMAIDAYRRAIEYGDDHVENYQALVECFLAMGEEDNALELLRNLEQYGENDVDIHCFIIEVALQCGKLELSTKHAHQLVRIQPTHAETYCYKAWGEIAQDDWVSAERTLRLGFHKAVDGAFALFELVEILLAEDDHTHAIQVARLAMELAPAHPESFAALGKVLRETGDLNEAFSAFRQASTLAPHDDSYLTWMGVVCDGMGDYHQAMQLFNAVLSHNHSDVWTLSNRGLAYMSMEMPEQALKDFQEGIAIDALDAPLYFWRACALVKLGDIERALSDLQRAVDLSDEIYAWLEEEPLLLPLIHDPRFRALLEPPHTEE